MEAAVRAFPGSGLTGGNSKDKVKPKRATRLDEAVPPSPEHQAVASSDSVAPAAAGPAVVDLTLTPTLLESPTVEEEEEEEPLAEQGASSAVAGQPSVDHADHSAVDPVLMEDVTCGLMFCDRGLRLLCGVDCRFCVSL